MELTFYTLDVFTDHIFGGNQLAVFPEAPDLATEVMQAIAREFNLSETVFVRPPKSPGALRRLRIFTPTAEMPFAGHPTIGTAQLLVELGLAQPAADGVARFSLEENVGLVPMEVARKNGDGYFTSLTAARVPECRRDVPAREALATLLGLQPGDIVIDERDAPAAWSAGVAFLCLPVRDREALARVSVDRSRWREILAEAWARDVFVFCHEPDGGAAHIRARMFAPGLGIVEDPATGSAAAAFAGYLWKRHGGPGRWIIAQGIEMGRPSTLHVEASGTRDRLDAVRVSGSAVRVSRGTLQLPAAREGDAP